MGGDAAFENFMGELDGMEKRSAHEDMLQRLQRLQAGKGLWGKGLRDAHEEREERGGLERRRLEAPAADASQDSSEETALPSYDALLAEIDQMEDAEEDEEADACSPHGPGSGRGLFSRSLAEAIAEPVLVSVLAAPARVCAAPAVEMRVDPEDGEAYPFESFIEEYGDEEGHFRWECALPQDTLADIERDVHEDEDTPASLQETLAAIERAMHGDQQASLQETLAAIDRDLCQDEDTQASREAFFELGRFSVVERTHGGWSDSDEDAATPGASSSSHFQPPLRRPPSDTLPSDEDEEEAAEAPPPRFIHVSRAAQEARMQRREEVRDTAKQRYTEALMNAMHSRSHRGHMRRGAGESAETAATGVSTAQAKKAVAMPKSQAVGLHSSSGPGFLLRS